MGAMNCCWFKDNEIMAKVRSILSLSGTLSGMTFVDSKAYGAHARAKRGTHKPITLAAGMKESAVVQTQVNLMAKIIFDAVKEFMPGFKDGKLWARLLSVFRQQKKAGKSFHYGDFNSKEIRVDYPTSKHGSFRLAKDQDKGLLLHYLLHKEEHYRLRLLRIAADETLLQAYPYETLTVDINSGTKIGEFHFDFSALPAGANILYVLHCERLIKGEPTGLLKGKGLRFLTAE